MIIKITDRYYEENFEVWYKIETENENLIENILYESYNEYEECEHICSVYEIFECALWEENICWEIFIPNMEFEIENSIERIR